jgi:hypothetical protein
LFGQKPDYSSLRLFGCARWLNLRPCNKHKLEFRSKQCVFPGFSNLHKGFKCLEISSGSVYISCDVTFDETVFPFSKLDSNAGARLRSDISLLPQSLLNPITNHGGEHIDDHVSDLHNITYQIDEAPAENSTKNDVPGDIEAETSAGDDLSASAAAAQESGSPTSSVLPIGAASLTGAASRQLHDACGTSRTLLHHRRTAGSRHQK